MSEDKEAQLLDLVSKSGYPLQIGIEEMVKETYQNHKWSIVGKEHFWTYPEFKREGFIDLVLSRKNMRMAVECKRVLDKDWIFLVANLPLPLPLPRNGGGERSENKREAVCSEVHCQAPLPVCFRNSPPFLAGRGVGGMGRCRF
jgi:hypothetical protein